MRIVENYRRVVAISGYGPVSDEIRGSAGTVGRRRKLTAGDAHDQFFCGQRREGQTWHSLTLGLLLTQESDSVMCHQRAVMGICAHYTKFTSPILCGSDDRYNQRNISHVTTVDT